MKVKFDLYLVPSPDASKEPQYYPRIVEGKTLSTNEIAENISKSCSLTQADIKGALSALAHEIHRNLSNGDNVYLEGIGYFNMIINSDKITDPKKVRATDIKFKAVNFRADKEMKSKFVSLEFIREKGNGNNKVITAQNIEKTIMDYLNEKPFITRGIIQTLCKISSTTACRYIKRMEQNEILKNINTKRNPVYVTLNNIGKDI